MLKRKLKAKPEEPPVKKRKQMKESKVIDLDQSSQSSRDIAKEDPCGRCNLTTVDKSIILKGMVLVVSIQCNFYK